MLHAALDGDEGAQQGDAGGEPGDGEGGAPAVGLGVGEAVHEREQARGGGQRAGQVDPRPARLHGAREETKGGGGGRNREDEVDEHRPPPVQVLGQRATEDQADGGARRADHAEDGEGSVALFRDGEGRGQQAQGRRREQRGERTLQRACADEDGEARCGTAERRRPLRSRSGRR